MRYIFAATLTSLATLAGCAGGGFPRNITDVQLREEDPPLLDECTSMSPQQAADRLLRAWEYCKPSGASGGTMFGVGGVGGGVLFVPIPISNAAYRKDLIRRGPEEFTLLMGGKMQPYNVADIKATEACPARVQIWGNGSLGYAVAKQSKVWLRDPEAQGPSPWCESVPSAK